MTSGYRHGDVSGEKALQDLVIDSDLARLEDLLAEFNLFDVLGIARRELQHSALLAWLIDPTGSHGLRDYFLRRFLSQAAAEAHELKIKVPTPIDVDGWSFKSLKVATERYFTVATKRSFIDVLLMDGSDGFVCLIENKIGSGEHSDHLDRYLRWVKDEFPDLTPFPIFLTPDGRKPEQEKDAKRYVPFDYGKLASLIEQALSTRGSTISESVSSFLEQYIRSLRRNVLDTTDNIDMLAYKLFTNHREAIDRIIRAKSVPDEIIRRFIESAVRQHAPDLQDDYHNQSCYRLFSSSLEEITQLHKGFKWTNSKRMVLFEFIHKDQWLTLFIMVGRGPDETRKCLNDIAQNGKEPWNPRDKFKESEHFAIHRKPILKQMDYSPFDPDNAKSKIEQAVREFYEHDYWRLVNDIREEFELAPIAESSQGA